jgi:Sulfotransferase family
MDKITIGKRNVMKPVFIVGRPRSGTKLLRSILNNHSEISIPFWESNFIPKYIEKADAFGDLSNYDNFREFYNFFIKIEFFNKITEKTKYKELGYMRQWYEAIENYTYAGSLSAFFKMYAQKNNKPRWGDKSPGYMLHIGELRRLFPDSKFVHIIRDVRDHCLSIMNVWNWNPYRAAQYWIDWIEKCKTDAQSYLANDYYEIKFENLITDSETEIKNLCSFLSIKYEKSMMILNRPTEEFGDAKNTKSIISDNRDKWRTKMPERMIRKIETISFNMLDELNYDIWYAKKGKRLSVMESKLARVEDTLHRFKFDCEYQGGIVKALKYKYMKKRYG